mgnify:CR=1 FL=1
MSREVVKRYGKEELTFGKFDGSKGHSLPRDPSKPWKGNFSISCGDAPYVCSGGPGYDTYAGKFAAGGAADAYPYSEQDDKYSALHGASAGGTAVTMYGPEQVPVKAAIAVTVRLTLRRSDVSPRISLVAMRCSSSPSLVKIWTDPSMITKASFDGSPAR